ncbi:MAG: TRAP transporter large permease subunit [Deltaproteobacteria bacterium]|nr:TRAP transporter large permease subunit [Deltaproteobacteria bacterium]
METLTIVLLVLLFVIAILVGSPLFTIIGGAAVLLFLTVAHESIAAIIIEMGRLANAPGITAIPLFIFAGYLFAESRSSTRLIRMSNAFLGWLPGGLAMVTVLVSSVFTAMTGASGITIIACGGILLPALLKDGYNKDFALGIVTASGSSGVLLVPSLPIIIYGMVSRTDISELFIATAVPAILIICCLGGYGVFYGIRNQVKTQKFSLREVFASLWEAKWEIPLPFIVVGGIYGGFITVGEAASAAAAYALISECLIYREITVRQLTKIGVDSMITVGAILVVLGTALGFTNFLVDQEVPQHILSWVETVIHSRYTFLIGLNVFLLIVGCVMDIFSAIVVVVPLIAPVAEGFGLDPVHLGVIFLANLELGYLTPPVGINLFIASLRFDVSVLKLYRVVLPFLFLLILALLLISYWPALSMTLLDVLGQRAEMIQI